MDSDNANNEEKSDSSPVDDQPNSAAENASDADASSAAGTSTEPTRSTKPPNSDKSKIEILLKAAGNAPILKKKKWIVPQDKTIGWIIDFIKMRCLKLEEGEHLFLYLNQSFAPAPDQVIANLYECFGAEGNLVFHYSLTPAWG